MNSRRHLPDDADRPLKGDLAISQFTSGRCSAKQRMDNYEDPSMSVDKPACRDSLILVGELEVCETNPQLVSRFAMTNPVGSLNIDIGLINRIKVSDFGYFSLKRTFKVPRVPSEDRDWKDIFKVNLPNASSSSESCELKSLTTLQKLIKLNEEVLEQGRRLKSRDQSLSKQLNVHKRSIKQDSIHIPYSMAPSIRKISVEKRKSNFFSNNVVPNKSSKMGLMKDLHISAHNRVKVLPFYRTVNQSTARKKKILSQEVTAEDTCLSKCDARTTHSKSSLPRNCSKSQSESKCNTNHPSCSVRWSPVYKGKAPDLKTTKNHIKLVDENSVKKNKLDDSNKGNKSNLNRLIKAFKNTHQKVVELIDSEKERGIIDFISEHR